MNWKIDQVRQKCSEYGPALRLAGIVDSYGLTLRGAPLLYALAGQESSFGADCGPRFEPRYWNEPIPEQAALNKVYGEAAAKSYGPWQVMYLNCRHLGTPAQIDANLDLAARAAVDFLNDYVIHDQGAVSLQQIARIYNSGNKNQPMTMGVMRYVENVGNYYRNAPLHMEVTV